MASSITTQEFADAFEAHRLEVRGDYTTAISDAIEAATAQFILEDQQQIVVMDIALFTMFFVTMKFAQAQGQELGDKKALMQAFRAVTKQIDKDVPESLLDVAKLAEGEG